MVSDHLYCDVCGSEYQIVPDFDPEIENSIAISMSEVSEIIGKNSKEKEVTFSHSSQFKLPPLVLISLILLICSAGIYMGYSRYINSVYYRSKQAIAAVNEHDYYKAEQIYEGIRKKNPQDAFWYVKEAELNLLLKKLDEAYDLALAAIGLEENRNMAYEFLLSYLKKKENYIEMKQQLQNCPLEEIREKYWEYLVEVPSLNYESGSYNETLQLVFEKGYEGTIYYTLDGTIPTVKSLQYKTPIKLGNGTHTVTAIYENKHHLISEPIVREYIISSEIPMNPVVTPSSGIYKIAEMIEIAVEEGTRVYYTTDLSRPTEESKEYTEPIPMPLGESRYNFIAVSEKGIASGVTQRNYMLNMRTNITLEEAETILVQKLISAGHILDKNGAIKDRYGVFHYFYKFPISEADTNFYVFEEHYMENQINNPLKHFYAVDVLYGSVYKLISDGEGNFTRVEF